MARESTFSFIPETSIKSRKEKQQLEHWVSISRKYNTIRFSPAYIRHKNLDGQFVKLYFDKTKNAIAWRLLKEKSMEGMRGYRQLVVKTAKAGKYTTESCQLGIKNLLDEMSVKEKKSFNKLEIKTYRPQAMLEDSYDYVVLK